MIISEKLNYNKKIKEKLIFIHQQNLQKFYTKLEIIKKNIATRDI